MEQLQAHLTRLVPVALSTVAALGLTFFGLRLVQRALRRADLCPPEFPLTRKLFPAVASLLLVAGARSALATLPKEVGQDLRMPLSLAVLWAAVYLLMRALWVAVRLVAVHFDIREHADNLRSRRVQTQLQFIEKLGHVTIVFLGACGTLLMFDAARSFGQSMLASAGVASLVIGFAAQKSLANLVAGFQIAFTQPLRIEDAVVVENEWGWVEEINLTYVVIRIWDQRRLVLPITYFVEKPFQNWTRTTAQILGAVELEVSHQVPFDEVERELFRILEETPLWDRDKRVLQMTEVFERSVRLRALMTAKDSPTTWDLRCLVRRKLVEFLRDRYPEALPVVRLVGHELEPHGEKTSAEAAE